MKKTPQNIYCILLCLSRNEKWTEARRRPTAPRRRRDAKGGWKQARTSNTNSADVLMEGGQGTSVRVRQHLPQTSEVTGRRNPSSAQLNLFGKQNIQQKGESSSLPEFQGTPANKRSETNGCHD